MKKILFEDATLTSQAKVTIDGVDHLVTEAEYNGGTDLNASTFNELQDNVEEAIENLKGKILWKNSDFSNIEFGAQEITLSSSDYDLLIWIFNLNTNSGQKLLDSAMCPKGWGVRLSGTTPEGGICRRDCIYISDTKYSLSDGYTGINPQNRRSVPYYVIGIKTGLFS